MEISEELQIIQIKGHPRQPEDQEISLSMTMDQLTIQESIKVPVASTASEQCTGQGSQHICNIMKNSEIFCTEYKHLDHHNQCYRNEQMMETSEVQIIQMNGNICQPEEEPLNMTICELATQVTGEVPVASTASAWLQHPFLQGNSSGWSLEHGRQDIFNMVKTSETFYTEPKQLDHRNHYRFPYQNHHCHAYEAYHKKKCQNKQGCPHKKECHHKNHNKQKHHKKHHSNDENKYDSKNHDKHHCKYHNKLHRSQKHLCKCHHKTPRMCLLPF